MMLELLTHNIKHEITYSKATVAYFTEEVKPSFAKSPLNFNGGLAKLGLTYLIKYTTGWLAISQINASVQDFYILKKYLIV